MSDQTIGLPKQARPAERASTDFSQTPTALKNLSDEDLMERLAEREPHALSVLFDRYHRKVFRVCLKVLRDPSEAEDVLQDVFFEIFRVAEKFDVAKGSAKAWILQYAYHRSLDRRKYLELRKRYSHPEIHELDVLESYYSPNSNNGWTSEELACVVEQWLKSLCPHQRDTLRLACFQGLSLPEIAQQTKKSLVSVQHYYYRGFRKLKDLLRDRAGS